MTYDRVICPDSNTNLLSEPQFLKEEGDELKQIVVL